MTDAALTRVPATEHADEIEDCLVRLLAERMPRAGRYGSHFAQLWQLATESVLGGKLIRPSLLIRTFDALAGGPEYQTQPRATALRIAAAIELLHFAFLIHDDVIDEDLIRRGAPNVIGKLLHDPLPVRSDAHGWDPARANRTHWARSNGILLGDLMLTAAHQTFAREPLPHPVRTRLLDLLEHTTTESVVGEHYDVGLSDGIIPANLETVIETSRLKTATYTFELPLRAGAILAGADTQLEEHLGEMARHLGTAFQLQDDLLSAFGDTRDHGKDAFSDFRERKETALIAFARTTSAWPAIEARFGGATFTEADGRAIRSLLASCGAEAAIGTMIDQRLRAATELSSSSGTVPRELGCLVTSLVDSLQGRTT